MAVGDRVSVLAIDTKHGTDIYVHATPEGAHKALAAWVRLWWDDDGPGTEGEPAPESDEEAVDAYFEFRMDSDSYLISDRTIEE